MLRESDHVVSWDCHRIPAFCSLASLKPPRRHYLHLNLLPTAVALLSCSSTVTAPRSSACHARSIAADSFDCAPIKPPTREHCFPQHLHGQDQPKQVFLPQQDSFDPCQGAGFDPHPIPAFQEWMWLDTRTAFECPSESIQLIRWRKSPLAAPRMKQVNVFLVSLAGPADDPGPL